MRWRRREQRERDLERELRSHLELEAEEQRETGLAPEAAQVAARRALGNAARIQETTREAWGYAWLHALLQDLRYGCRTLKNNPGVAAIVILTAALGIGANTSIFGVIDAVLFHPLPYPDAAQLVCASSLAREGSPEPGKVVFWVPDFQYAAWREQAEIFDGVAAYTGVQRTITSDGEPERLRVQMVTPGFLHTLRVAPRIGRDLTAADAAPRGGQVALLTHAFWTRRFGGDPAILSRQMTLDGKPYSIAGVLPHDFEFPENADIQLLLAMSEPSAQPKGGVYFYNAIARLKRGVTVQRAESDLAVIDDRLKTTYQGRLGRTSSQTRLIGLQDKLVGDVRPALLVLGGAVALVLLIACVNICNLLLARAMARQREIAVRIALGAGQGRVMRQLLTEGMLLAAAGGAAGLAIAFGGMRLLRAIAPDGVPHIESARIGAAVLVFNLAIAMFTGLLFGLAPLRGVSGIDPEAALKNTVRTASGSRKQRRLESVLIVAETAFALILLAGAGLLLRTFAGLTAITPGFQPDNVTAVKLSLPYWKYRTEGRRQAFLDAAMEKLRNGPGVQLVSAVACLPYGGFVMTGSVEIEGRPAAPDAHTEGVAVNFTLGDYFRAMGVPILEGRAIEASDRAGSPVVAVVNQTLARRFFPDGRVLGSHIRIPGVTPMLEIVGVAGSVKQGGLASEPRAEIFQSAAQSESGSSVGTLVVRATTDPRILTLWLQARIAELDKELPPPEIATMRAKMAALMASQVFVMRLLGLFAAIAIALAAIGIYSVMAYSVERRSHEIAIRVALGARRVNIMRLILGRGLGLSAAGAAIGVAGGLVLTRYLKSLLYGVAPHDPATMVTGCAAVLLMALCAAYIPARRASRHDAAVMLRAE